MLPKFTSTNEEINDIREQFRNIHSLKIEIDKFKIPKWDNEYKDKVINDFTYHSNKLEGNSLTYGETIAFLKESTFPQGKSAGDVMDIKSHANIMKDIMQQYDKFELSIESVKTMHGKLMDNILQWKNGEDYAPGRFKWDTNYTTKPNGELRQFMSVDVFKEVLNEIFNDVNNALKNKDESKLETHPLYVSTYFHQNFEYAHPFTDGNGRIGRIMSNVILLKENYVPIVIQGNERDRYLNLLDKGTIENDKKQAVSPQLLQFFCEKETQALTQKLETIKTLQQERNNNNSMSL
jgi:Fic family protein